MVSENRLNAYHIMWLFVLFDLPTNTKKERKAAARFRNDLLNDGFTMVQYSVYSRHCASRQSMQVHIDRIEKNLPEYGNVNIMFITDKQYGQIISFFGKKSEPLPPGPRQLELF